MKIHLELTTTEGEFVEDTERGIVCEGPSGKFRILRPDFITLQTREEDGRGVSVCRVTSLTVDGNTGRIPESPEVYLFRLFVTYAKYHRRLKPGSPDAEVNAKLSDISRKIEQLCRDRNLPNPIKGITS